MATQSDSLEHVKTGLKVASELIVPGGSNLIKGDYKQAGIHAALGLVARAFFGLPGLVLVSANSYVKASTGRGLLEHLDLVKSDYDTTSDDAATTRRKTT
ncbi:MAG: hypothetical protein JOZ52_01925 [Acidobacteria bacterium]|nr:hypothetical protein [Acidobacteriota bacterium]